MNVLNTDKTTAELLLQFNEDYIIEVKATTEGGDGTSSDQILIPRLASTLKLSCCCVIVCFMFSPQPLSEPPLYHPQYRDTSLPLHSDALLNVQLTPGSCHRLSLHELSPY